MILKTLHSGLFALILAAQGCGNSFPEPISGKVLTERRTSDYYEISIQNVGIGSFRTEPSFSIRFYSKDFNLGELDGKINNGNIVYLHATETSIGDEYNYKADRLVKIE